MCKIYPLGVLLFAAMTMACSVDKDPLANADPRSETTGISVEAALSNLRTVLDATGTLPATRGGVSAFDVHDVQALTTGVRTGSGESRNLAYVVNFQQGGYAVLGADVRQSPLVALAGSGSLAPEDLIRAREAVDAGLEVDAPTLMRAAIAGYLDRKLADPVVAPQTRATPIVVKEFQDSMMRTSWSPEENELAGCTRTKIALAQTMVYNAEFLRYFPTMLKVHVLMWSQIAPVARYRHLGDSKYGPMIGMLLDPVNEYVSDDDPSILSSICLDLLRYANENAYTTASVAELNVQNVREMIFVRKKPTIGCFDGMAMQNDGWTMDGWMKMSVGNVESNLVHCKFAKDLVGTDDGFYEVEVVGRGVAMPQKMIVY